MDNKQQMFLASELAPENHVYIIPSFYHLHIVIEHFHLSLDLIPKN